MRHDAARFPKWFSNVRSNLNRTQMFYPKNANFPEDDGRGEPHVRHPRAGELAGNKHLIPTTRCRHAQFLRKSRPSLSVLAGGLGGHTARCTNAHPPGESAEHTLFSRVGPHAPPGSWDGWKLVVATRDTAGAADQALAREEAERSSRRQRGDTTEGSTSICGKYGYIVREEREELRKLRERSLINFPYDR